MKGTRKMVALTAALGVVAVGCVACDARTDSVQVTDDTAAVNTGAVAQAASDGWIQTKVLTELTTTKGIEREHIDVDVKNAVVTLTGVLPDETQVKKAIAAAKSVEGVEQVDASGLKVK